MRGTVTLRPMLLSSLDLLMGGVEVWRRAFGYDTTLAITLIGDRSLMPFRHCFLSERVFGTRSTWILSAVLLSAALGACSYVPRPFTEYKIDIQQGNVLTQDMVAQLKPGLTKDQVRFILGTPVLTDMFHANRWDYVYRLQKGSTGEVEERKFSTFFVDSGRLVRVGGDVTAMQASDLEAKPANRLSEIDLGSIPPDTVAPQVEQKGFFGNMMESLGL